eukprot:10969347-Alexandrium_andersonii.AAC.1
MAHHGESPGHWPGASDRGGSEATSPMSRRTLESVRSADMHPFPNTGSCLRGSFQLDGCQSATCRKG